MPNRYDRSANELKASEAADSCAVSNTAKLALLPYLYNWMAGKQLDDEITMTVRGQFPQLQRVPLTLEQPKPHLVLPPLARELPLPRQDGDCIVANGPAIHEVGAGTSAEWRRTRPGKVERCSYLASFSSKQNA